MDEQVAKQSCEVLVVGAGPAGLTAALYLARFRRRLVVIDGGRSRARYIPVSRNCPGFAHGVSGEALLSELREQAERHGVRVVSGVVDALSRTDACFAATTADRHIEAQRVILATGVVDVLPEMPGVEPAIRDGLVRLCPVCDAYETEDRTVAVFGPPASAAGHARYMRSFARRVAAVACDHGRFTQEQRAKLAACDIAVIEEVEALELVAAQVRVRTRGGQSHDFDAFYPVLGARPRSQLALGLGASCTASGDLQVDAHLRTSVRGLYAIGDVVSALNQIAVGLGHAAIAATAIHNELPERLL